MRYEFLRTLSGALLIRREKYVQEKNRNVFCGGSERRKA
jgi:hypothetical protein